MKPKPILTFRLDHFDGAGHLQVNQAKRLKDMEKENARLRKAISDLMLDKQILEEVIKGKF